MVRSFRDIDSAVWAHSFSRQCKDSRFYEIIEETLRDKFEHRYLVLTNRETGKAVVQPFFFVDQDIIAGSPRPLRMLVARLRKKLPRFFILKMLMVGCAAGEGHLGSEETWAVQSLQEALDAFGKQSGASIILLKDFPARYRKALASFSDAGYQRAPSMPGARLALGYASFEDYLQRKVGKVFRKNLRRKFRKLEEVPPITMEVLTDATEHVNEIYKLYHQTFTRSEFQFEELNKDYFCLLGQRMPDRVRFFLWRQSGNLIALSICMVHDDALYDLELGLDYAVALDLHMYFVTWRDIVQWAIDHGLKSYHTGPLNYDPKLHLKLELSPHDLYARHTVSLFNPIFRIAMKYLQPARHNPTLRKFPNAQEL